MQTHPFSMQLWAEKHTTNNSECAYFYVQRLGKTGPDDKWHDDESLRCT
jgi:hypothetical protein